MFKVSYLHGKGYRVSRTFDTRKDAQTFIDNNAMVWPLPGVRLTGPPEIGSPVLDTDTDLIEHAAKCAS